MKTKVSSKGHIELPAEIRQQDDIRTGQQFDVERLARGKYQLIRQTNSFTQGLVDWLLECPEKGYFVPIESEDTDTL